jgi:hypothetical protein
MAVDVNLVKGFKDVDVSGIMANRVKTAQDITQGAQKIQNNNITNEAGNVDIQARKLDMLQKIAQGVKTIDDMPRAIKFSGLASPEISQQLQQQFAQDPEGTFAATQNFAGQDLKAALQEYRLKNEKLEYERNLNGGSVNFGQPQMQPLQGQFSNDTFSQPVLDKNNLPIVKSGSQYMRDANGNFTWEPIKKSGTTVDPVTGEVVSTPKLSGTEQKALFDSTASIQGGNFGIKALTSALDLLENGLDKDPKATPYSGTGSELLASTQRSPVGMPFFDVADPKRATATTKYNNLILSQAFTNLKSLFGSNPTEGERKALKDLQAISSYTPSEQKEIIKTSLDLAKFRRDNEIKKSKATVTQDYRGFVDDISGEPIPVTPEQFKELPEGGNEFENLSNEEFIKIHLNGK